MENADLQYVRTQMVEGETPPRSVQGFSHWLRVNLFATPVDAALTLFGLAIVAWFLPSMIQWLFVNAAWTGSCLLYTSPSPRDS